MICSDNRLRSNGRRAKARLDIDVARQAAHRLGTLAILTAVSMVGMTVLQSALQPELAATPVFRLSAVVLMLASLGVAALERSALVGPQVLLDAGLAFEVAGAFVIGVTENPITWTDSPVRGSTAVATTRLGSGFCSSGVCAWLVTRRTPFLT